MSITVITPPASEPVTLEEFAHYARLDVTDDKNETAFRNLCIQSAREYCENYQRRAYITQTLELSLDKFPSAGVIEIPRGSLQKVDSVKYTDASGVEHTLIENVDYVYSTRGILGRISPVASWPSDNLAELDAVKIQFTCGYVKIPYKTKLAICMLASYWQQQRLPVLTGSISKEIEFSVHSLLNPNKIGVF